MDKDPYFRISDTSSTEARTLRMDDVESGLPVSGHDPAPSGPAAVGSINLLNGHS
ncbi:MAG: hypothetical protein AVDCRST_MAG83-3530 [uncultured Arthrobacter sp.]|uniref:Uncharacterized protein n=1 Tax=uncultured Arthrobacter sp. TaxID=114050 RepID=A0A6J4JBP6_9MICC|nr:MAG: hypothetical protein AVDCRST_MAG83-3530 [uncultured Arthrobacter sp.]